MPKTAVIIKGNPAFVDGDPRAAAFYADLRAFLETLGYHVTLDPGEPYTQPGPANVWIGHSRGVDRLRFAPPTTIAIALGTKGGINHPKDSSLEKGDVPDENHYLLTDEMKAAIAARLDR